MKPDKDFTPLAEAAIQVREMFQAYVTAGFTESQALYLTGQILANAAHPQPPSP